MPSFRILIPAYKEDNVILETVENVLALDYPAENREIIVIADSLQPDTLAKLSAYPIQVLEVNFEQSTKAASLRYALQILPDDYEWSIVLDADNHIDADFLRKIIAFILKYPKCQILQAHRTAKNQNTVFARLDAISEEVNNTIFRKGHNALGLSSALIGSGMVIRSNFYEKCMEKIEAVSGFDKELELAVLTEKIRIYYLPDIKVYDEKVQKAQVFGKQRRRWVSAQWFFAGKAWAQAIPQLILHKNIDYFNKALQLSLLPRLMHLGLIFILALFSILHLIPFAGFWVGLLLANVLTIANAIPNHLWNKNLLKDLMYLPVAFFLMVKALGFIKSARHTFIHTPHNFHSKNQ
jgi:cellulose synthase/poly-beta-1,6-N-acetylglucosamine synthase-like glycosyltransferase